MQEEDALVYSQKMKMQSQINMDVETQIKNRERHRREVEMEKMREGCDNVDYNAGEELRRQQRKLEKRMLQQKMKEDLE